MIRHLGLHWAYRTLGILAVVVNTSCILLVKDRNKTIGSNQAAFDLEILRRGEYLLLLGFSAFTMLGYFILIFSLANFATSIGLSSSQASVASSLFNLGQAIGRPLIRYFNDTIGRINMAASMTFIAGIIPVTIWTNTGSYGLLIFFALAEGLVSSQETSGPPLHLWLKLWGYGMFHRD
ncbi:hypothetical protein N7532_006929 [Penicillium argentinense]|uniref:Major facilitator superfamily (MFS) profile domain-containing protein n=1 Tax=Penicillium argentinense TaxID=1131581 RepID=A0A9W9KBE0_9EURO|nr:uncharacterized protein N7532_006929 [Penicillium argentinense]KAJ5099928.1 hypothetical protein N7532_006929 [Penicillium argentinense]